MSFTSDKTQSGILYSSNNSNGIDQNYCVFLRIYSVQATGLGTSHILFHLVHANTKALCSVEQRPEAVHIVSNPILQIRKLRLING